MRIFSFTMSVCEDCLDARGQECHSPECAFFLHDVPHFDTAHALRSARDIDDMHEIWVPEEVEA